MKCEAPKKSRFSKGIRILLKTAIAVFAIAVAMIVTLLLLMWREHRTAITLPPPTGTFMVGRTSFTWTDETPLNRSTPPPEKRQVVAWVWYPAMQGKNDPPAPYLPPLWRAALASHQGTLMSSFFKRDLAAVRTHSASDAPISTEQSQYPVVLMRAGGSALTTDFTTLAEDLASHGYFVVGFDAPYRSFVVVLPDGRVISRLAENNVENANSNLDDPVVGRLLRMWTSDTQFVVNQLERLNEDRSSRFRGRMALDRLGMFGHSFGGATALQFCHEDSRCKAAADFDGIPFGSVVREGLSKPCMFVLSDHAREMSEPSSRQVLAEIKSIYDKLPDGRLYITIRTANHFSFSDQILLNSQTAAKVLRHIAGFGGLDGHRGLSISADYVHTFFDVYLKGAPASSLATLFEKYQEVEQEGR